MNIQVSNLSTTVDNEELKKMFSPYGEVKSANVVKDVFTESSRGFGFVEMEDGVQAQKAIDGLNNNLHDELTLSVQEAKPKTIHTGSYKVGNGPIEVYRFKKK